MFKVEKRCNAASPVNRVRTETVYSVSFMCLLECFVFFSFMELLALCILTFSCIYMLYCVCFVLSISMDDILECLEGAY